MGWFLWGLLSTALLTNSWTITFWIWGVLIGGSVVVGCYRGHKQVKEQKRLQREIDAEMRFHQSVNNFKTNEYDAKHRYCVNISFSRYIKGFGFYVTKTSDSIEYLKSRAESFNESCHVVIRENVAGYPNFDWVIVEEYNLKF